MANIALQEEGGANWSYSQGEIEDLLQSKQPLPPQLQELMEARSAFAELNHPFANTPACRNSTLPVLVAMPRTMSAAAFCRCADSHCTFHKRHSCRKEEGRVEFDVLQRCLQVHRAAAV